MEKELAQIGHEEETEEEPVEVWSSEGLSNQVKISDPGGAE